jgi:ubiquinone/menaquinone biosynthesis C-methylase UbiE
MDHHDHVNLLRNGIPESGGIWADFGSGRGAFTLALAELIGPTGEIYSVDKDRGALRQQERTMKGQFPKVTAHFKKADFTKPLDLPLLDGLVIANALHYLRHKDETIRLLANYLRPGGCFLMVEYNTDRGNTWVPHPFSYPTWEKLARRNGLVNTQLLATVPSRFLGQIYSAISFRPE